MITESARVQPIVAPTTLTILLIAVVAAVGLLALGSIALAAAAVVGGVVTSVIWAKPALAVSLLMVLTFSVDYLTEELALLPHAAQWSIEAMIALIALRALVSAAHAPMIRTGIELPLLFLLVLCLISSTLHQVAPERVALGVRGLFRFVLLFIALVHLRLPEGQWRSMLRLFFALMALQVPIALYQWGMLGKTDDQVFGSVRSTGVLIVLIIITICLLTARFLRERARPMYLVMALPMFVLPIIGEAKAFFLLMPATLLVLLRNELLRRPMRTLAAGLLLAAAVVVSLGRFSSVAGNANLVTILRQPDQWAGLLEGPRKGGKWEADATDITLAASLGPRFSSLVDTVAAVQSRGLTVVAGFGIGSRTFTHAEVQEDAEKRLFAAPVALRLYELGYLGLALYWLMFLGVTVRLWRLRRSPSPFWRALHFAFPAIVFVYIVSDLYTDSLYDPLAFVLWFIAAMLVAAAQRHETLPAARHARPPIAATARAV